MTGEGWRPGPGRYVQASEFEDAHCLPRGWVAEKARLGAAEMASASSMRSAEASRLHDVLCGRIREDYHG